MSCAAHVIPVTAFSEEFTEQENILSPPTPPAEPFCCGLWQHRAGEREGDEGGRIELWAEDWRTSWESVSGREELPANNANGRE